MSLTEELVCRLSNPVTVGHLHRVMLAVEGPDGSGKSTLVGAIRSVLRHHCYVFDRWWLTCKVMDEYMHRPADLRRDVDVEIYNLSLAGYLPLAVVLLPPVPVLGQHLASRGDTSHTTAELEELTELFSTLKIPCPTYYHSDYRPDTGFSLVRDVAERVASWVLDRACE